MKKNPIQICDEAGYVLSSIQRMMALLSSVATELADNPFANEKLIRSRLALQGVSPKFADQFVSRWKARVAAAKPQYGEDSGRAEIVLGQGDGRKGYC
jgi:hypothetical protein